MSTPGRHEGSCVTSAFPTAVITFGCVSAACAVLVGTAVLHPQPSALWAVNGTVAAALVWCATQIRSLHHDGGRAVPPFRRPLRNVEEASADFDMLVRQFADDSRIPPEELARHVDRYMQHKDPYRETQALLETTSKYVR